MSKTRAVPKTLYRPVPREPHCSPDSWLIEPFDEELELWTLGAEYGFLWVLIAADPSSQRCRVLTRDEGIRDLKEQLAQDPTEILFAGSLVGDSIDVELANFMVHVERYKPADVTETAVMLARLCERLKDLQFYDGDSRLKAFEKAGESEGGAISTTFWTTLGIDVA
jgi:hypothetical protein